MIRKLTLAAGFGAGYVLGAKAGTQRYDQIVAKFRELAGMPAVQELKHNVVDTASQLGDKAMDKVSEKLPDALSDLGAAKPPVTPPAKAPVKAPVKAPSKPAVRPTGAPSLTQPEV